jgi:hypothetical protein
MAHEQIRRWLFALPTRVHPCLCGFACPTYAEMKRHRRKCSDWKDRQDPRGLTISRRKASKTANVKARLFIPCPACGQRPDAHDDQCPHSQAEFLRREAIARNGIDPKFWAAFLKELGKCY